MKHCFVLGAALKPLRVARSCGKIPISLLLMLLASRGILVLAYRIKLYEGLQNLWLHLLDIKSLSWFLCVGGVSALVNLGVFSLCWHFFRWPNVASVSVAYFISVLVHFLGNRYITFSANKHQPLLHNLKKYLVMVVVNYLISVAVVHVATAWFGVYPPLAVCLAIAVTVGVGFFLSKMWVFKHHSKGF